MHVPAASSVAAEDDAVQIVGVVEDRDLAPAEERF